MDNENIVNDQSPSSKVDETEHKGIGVVWKVVVVVAAIIIIVIFGFQFMPGQSDSNIESVSSSSQTTPNDSEADDGLDDSLSAKELFEQGNDFVQTGQLPHAVKAYNKAIEKDPDYQAAYANLGVVYYQLEQLDLAAEQYEKALELDPEDGDVAYNLGALKLQQALLGGQPDPDLINQAIDQLQESLELSPDLAEPHFSLGVAYATLDRKEEAIQSFERFLEEDSGQDPRASQEAQRYLENLSAQ